MTSQNFELESKVEKSRQIATNSEFYLVKLLDLPWFDGFFFISLLKKCKQTFSKYFEIEECGIQKSAAERLSL